MIDPISADDHADIMARIERDPIDGCDEEIELEFEDRWTEGGPEGADGVHALTAERQAYFRELFRLQAELVKL
jgi:hypothetical protein